MVLWCKGAALLCVFTTQVTELLENWWWIRPLLQCYTREGLELRLGSGRPHWSSTQNTLFSWVNKGCPSALQTFDVNPPSRVTHRLLKGCLGRKFNSRTLSRCTHIPQHLIVNIIALSGECSIGNYVDTCPILRPVYAMFVDVWCVAEAVTLNPLRSLKADVNPISTRSEGGGC